MQAQVACVSVWAHLGEVDPVLEQRGLVLAVAALRSGHVELARDLRVQRGVAVVLALPARGHMQAPISQPSLRHAYIPRCAG